MEGQKNGRGPSHLIKALCARPYVAEVILVGRTQLEELHLLRNHGSEHLSRDRGVTGTVGGGYGRNTVCDGYGPGTVGGWDDYFGRFGRGGDAEARVGGAGGTL